MSFGFQSALHGRLRASAIGAFSAAALAFCAAPSPTSALSSSEELRPLDPAERGLIGKLNDERQLVLGPEGEPLARLNVSSALTQAASDYAELLRATGQFSHHADGRTAAERALEAGFVPAPGPGLSVAEDLFEGASAEHAYAAWKSSPSHAAVLFHADAHWVGLGRSADKWVLLVGGHCAQGQCEPATERRQGTAAPAALPRAARLRSLVRRRGRTVTVRVRLLEGEGRVVVGLRRGDGRSARRRRVSHRGDVWRYVFRLPGPGMWRATVRLRPDLGWTSVLLRSRRFAVRE